MKVAIMQPYLFPYIGYYHLIDSVDKFVIFNDVDYIKKGWINRNNILSHNKKDRMLFTFSLIKASQNKKINEIDVDWYNFDKKTKFFDTIKHVYGKAPHFDNTFQLLYNAVQFLGFRHHKLHALLWETLYQFKLKFEMDTQIVSTSADFNNAYLKGQNRIIDICKQLKATTYVNAIGGKDLYDHKIFEENNIELKFVKSNPIEYPQYKSNPFVPYLSIIDVLMFNDMDLIKKELIKDYELID